jgi:hypothetical protein
VSDTIFVQARTQNPEKSTLWKMVPDTNFSRWPGGTATNSKIWQLVSDTNSGTNSGQFRNGFPVPFHIRPRRMCVS